MPYGQEDYSQQYGENQPPPDLTIPVNSDPSVIGSTSHQINNSNNPMDGDDAIQNFLNNFQDDNSQIMNTDSILSGNGGNVYLGGATSDGSGAASLDAGGQASSGGFWESLGNVFGDAFNNVSTAAGNALGNAVNQNVNTAVNGAVNGINHAGAAATPTNNTTQTDPLAFLKTPTGLLISALLLGGLIYVAIKANK